MTLGLCVHGVMPHISIHIPRVGDDDGPGVDSVAKLGISIHIPRVGDDCLIIRANGNSTDFNPHPPCGG